MQLNSRPRPSEQDPGKPHEGRPAPGVASRLLVVSYHFPPDGSVGALRWGGLSKYLGRAGWEVQVVTEKSEANWEPQASVTVRSCAALTTVNDRYREWRAPSGSAPSDTPTNGTETRGRGASDDPRPSADLRDKLGLRPLAREVGAFLGWPDAGRGWIIPAARGVQRTLLEFDPDVIVSSGPPHSAHLAVAMARGASEIPWFMDWRDPWAQARCPTELFRTTLKWVERWAINRATGLIVTTPELKRELNDRYPGVPVHWLSNGVDLELFPPAPPRSFPGLSAIHLGTVYGGRNPAPILSGFSQFLRDVPEARRDGSCLRFVGTLVPEYRAGVDAAASGPLADHVELLGRRPRAEALTMLRRSSLAVVLAQNQRQMVPAKLYESVALRIPTLVISERGSASYRAAERLGTLRAEPHDVNGIAAALRVAWEGNVTGPDPSRTRLDYRSLASEAAAILRST